MFKIFGPKFRSQKISLNNISKALPNLSLAEQSKILEKMWFNYGMILAEYVFINKFRNSNNFSKNILVENQNELDSIRNKSKPVIFISGHFNNFELMAMHIEKSGIDLAAIYRPLNNKFLNPIMESIRKKYICKKQIKKGMSGVKESLKKFKEGTSIALMIDQRVSEGIRSELFGEKSFTTTIPAQFVKKFGAEIVPVYVERIHTEKFKIKFHKALKFSSDDSIENITLELNKILEKMILKNPEQWIWTHNRWK
tara:strand:- start:15 stop:776 length:762 start_codon:yes stop_codon:yes gene_type:complete